MQSYQGNSALVALSLLSFFTGYRICQHSVSNKSVTEYDSLLQLLPKDKIARKLAYIVAGTLMMSQGFVFLTSAISGSGLINSLAGGLLVILGYVPAHLSINQTVI